MRKRSLILIQFSIFLTGCTLAGDLTPPAVMATSQAAEAVVAPTHVPIQSPTTISEIVSISAPDTERGASLYVEKCAPCHGESGLGDGSQASALPVPASPIGDLEFARTASPIEWFDVVTEGRIDKFMPGFESLNDQERWDVVAYAFTLSSQPMDILLGGEIFTGICADCHGSDGAGTEKAPDLTRFEWISQNNLDQIIATIGKGISPGMPAFEDTLIEDERQAVARFIQNLSFPGTSFHSAGNEIPPEGESTDPDAIIEAKISGQIINGTEGGNIPSGLEVTLYGFDGQQSAFTDKTIVSESGEYHFEGVEIQPGRVFVATVKYQGATYGSEVVHIADEFELDLPITIYDTTSDLSQVQVDRLHLIFDMPAEGILQVTELWILSNLGDRAIATESGEGVFQVQLPEGAANLGFEEGSQSARFVPTTEGNGFVDHLPIRPGMGSHEIVFSFNMSMEDELDLSQSLGYSVEAVVLLAPQGVVELEGKGIEDLGLRQMSGAALHNYSAGPLSAADELEITVIREKASTGESKNTIGIVAGIALLIVALSATGFWLDRRINKRDIGLANSSVENKSSDASIDEEMDRERLLQEIADLDDAFESGEIEETDYQRLRQDLKSQLMEVL